MNTENVYQVLDDLEAFADQIGSEWMKERVAMLEAQIGNLETFNNHYLRQQQQLYRYLLKETTN